MTVYTWHKLFSQQRARFSDNVFRIRPMRAPEIWMIRNRCVFRVETLGRGIKQMKTLVGDPCDDFGSRSAPRKRFANAKQATCACDRCKHSVGVQWLNGAQIDNFNLQTFARELLSSC